eukprot:TRINITY_DN65975_c0_g1_i1.p1 TRINITY_DN65975_c0_g1~~TRINITY_DN65975_c0_g1_i1.p1  ORF type:complete len:384 (-),score=31.57 TRINITY_DN65975_c0_g1_i1:1170-2282(-)
MNGFEAAALLNREVSRTQAEKVQQIRHSRVLAQERAEAYLLERKLKERQDASQKELSEVRKYQRQRTCELAAKQARTRKRNTEKKHNAHADKESSVGSPSPASKHHSSARTPTTPTRTSTTFQQPIQLKTELTQTQTYKAIAGFAASTTNQDIQPTTLHSYEYCDWHHHDKHHGDEQYHQEGPELLDNQPKIYNPNNYDNDHTHQEDQQEDKEAHVTFHLDEQQEGHHCWCNNPTSAHTDQPHTSHCCDANVATTHQHGVAHMLGGEQPCRLQFHHQQEDRGTHLSSTSPNRHEHARRRNLRTEQKLLVSKLLQAKVPIPAVCPCNVSVVEPASRHARNCMFFCNPASLCSVLRSYAASCDVKGGWPEMC